MRAGFVEFETLAAITAQLTPANRLVCEIALATGLRVSDVLGLRIERLNLRPTVIEQKTGKRRRVFLGKRLLQRCKVFAGGRKSGFLFQNRDRSGAARTRQAVFLDVRKKAAQLGVTENITPHTFRKAYAVKLYRRYGDVLQVQKRLGHEYISTTMLYCFADKL